MNSNPSFNLHRAWISSATITSLFEKYQVPHNLDFLSVDIDSVDFWVLRAIITGGFRPRLITVEYNSNFPVGVAIVAADDGMLPRTPASARGSVHATSVYKQHHDKEPEQPWLTSNTCCRGASASAIAMLADELGYVIVDVVK